MGILKEVVRVPDSEAIHEETLYEIDEGIWVGAAEIASQRLEDFTHVIMLLDEKEIEDPAGLKKGLVKFKGKFLSYNDVRDAVDTDWAELLTRTDLNKFLDDFEDARKSAKGQSLRVPKPKLLVFCKHGKVRSPFMIAYILIKYRKLGTFEALRTVSEKRERGIGDPRVHFHEQAVRALEKYGGEMQGNWEKKFVRFDDNEEDGSVLEVIVDGYYTEYINKYVPSEKAWGWFKVVKVTES